MYVNLLLLRYKQLLRVAFQLGVVRALLVFCVIVVAIAMTYIVVSSEKNAYLVTSLYLFLCLMIHLKRKDKNYLKINAPHFRTIYFVEYMMLSFPLIICLLLCSQWVVLLYAVVGILLVSVVDYNMDNRCKTLNTRLQKRIPFDLYEWKAGVRKYFVLMLIIYGLGVCLSMFVAVISIAMIIIGLIISDFYLTHESWQMVLSYAMSAEKMILYKIKRHIFMYAICNLPLVILFVLFHHVLWYIPIIVFAALLSVHIYMITIKYAYYKTNGNSSISSVSQLIGIIFGLTLIMIPFLLLFTFFGFQKACTNLNPLLHDFDL